MKMNLSAWIVGSFLTIAGIVPASENLDIPVSSGGNTTTRHLNYYAPSGLNNPALVVLMHGAQGNGNNLAEGLGWDSIAMREKFVVATPSSVGSFWDLGGTSDIDFVLAIIDTMANRFHIDRNRVYASGWSMGGMMSYYLACHTPEKIAAIGPSSGYLIYGQSGCSTTREVPIYHIHGIWDDFVKYSDLHDYLKNNWLNNYGCPAVADSSKPGLGGTLLESWDNCSNNGQKSEVYLESYWKPHGIGPEEAEVFWNFLHKYSLNAEPISSVTLYERTNLHGQLTKLTEGNYTHVRLKKIGLPDSVLSSILVPTGMTVTVYDNDNFQNPLGTYTSNAGDLSAIKTKITAIRVTSANNPIPIPTTLGATFYQFSNYGGLNTKLAEGSYTLSQLQLASIPDNAVNAMKVDPGLTVELFDNDNFQVKLGSFDSDLPDFGTNGFGNKVTSLRIVKTSSLSSSSVAASSTSVAESSSTTAVSMHGPKDFSGSNWSIHNQDLTLNISKTIQGTIVVYDIFGKSRKVLSTGSITSGSHTFHVGNLEKGIYLARLSSGEQSFAYKFKIVSP